MNCHYSCRNNTLPFRRKISRKRERRNGRKMKKANKGAWYRSGCLERGKRVKGNTVERGEKGNGKIVGRESSPHTVRLWIVISIVFLRVVFSKETLIQILLSDKYFSKLFLLNGNAYLLNFVQIRRLQTKTAFGKNYPKLSHL